MFSRTDFLLDRGNAHDRENALRRVNALGRANELGRANVLECADVLSIEFFMVCAAGRHAGAAACASLRGQVTLIDPVLR